MKILFISHEAGRTGAPFVLLHLCKWLKENTDIKIDILFLSDGPMISKFKPFSDAIFIKESTHLGYGKRALRKVSPLLYHKYFGNKQVKRLIANNYSVIYANSIASLNFGLTLKKNLHVPLILHLHELFINIEFYHKHLACTQKEVNHFICASKAVKDNVVKNFGVPEEKASIIYEFVDFEGLKNKIGNSIELPTNEVAFTVCASGTLNWRKNPDTFIQVAKRVRKLLPNKDIQFLWVGANEDNNLKIYSEDIKKSNSEDYIHIVKKTDTPFDYYNRANVFLMTSKEDPFPLVCIESGYLGKPIICFKNAGGIPEMIAQGGGKVVDYLDNDAMADAIIEYYNNPKNLKEDSTYIQQKVLDYDIVTQGPKVFELIKKVIHG